MIIALILVGISYVARTDNYDSYRLYDMNPAVQKSARGLHKDQILLIEGRSVMDEAGEYRWDYGISWLNWYYGVRSEEDLAYYAAQRGAETWVQEWPSKLYVIYPDLRIDEVKSMVAETGNTFPYYWGQGMPSSCERVAGKILDATRMTLSFCLRLHNSVDVMASEDLVAPVFLAIGVVIWIFRGFIANTIADCRKRFKNKLS